MYSWLPPRQRLIVRAALATAWWLVTLGGIASIVVNDPSNILGDVFGAAVVATSGVAGAGAAWNRFRWEWIAAWFAAASLTPFVLMSVAASYRNIQALPGTILLAALAASFCARALLCAAHAAKLREQHEATRGDAGDV